VREKAELPHRNEQYTSGQQSHGGSLLV
jgi:hypothetical protein